MGNQVLAAFGLIFDLPSTYPTAANNLQRHWQIAWVSQSQGALSALPLIRVMFKTPEGAPTKFGSVGVQENTVTARKNQFRGHINNETGNIHAKSHFIGSILVSVIQWASLGNKSWSSKKIQNKILVPKIGHEQSHEQSNTKWKTNQQSDKISTFT